MSDNTIFIFDSVFKTMVHRAPQLMIPFINETFGRSYPQDTPIVQFSTEHEGLKGTIIADSVFRLGDKIYHVECQSTADTSMVMRMIEYDFAIALEQALGEGAPYEMDFPSSCVLYLRHTSTTPDSLDMKVNLPDGESFVYSVKVVKAQRYSSEELFEKHLLLLLPFYLMRYEHALGDIAADDARAARLVAECAELRASLEALIVETGDTILYEELVELIIRVSDYLLETHEILRKRVRKAMGGEVLELMRERSERLEREAEARGLEQGLEQGLERGLEELAKRLIERGVDASLIDEAVAEAREERRKED